MKTYNKLFRDKIPGLISDQGERPLTKVLTGDALLAALDKKLDEEVAEYQESKEPEELADILEVLYAIAEARGHSKEELLEIRENKFRERGGFAGGIYLISKE